MAGDWIKMRVDLGEDPAVITIADALDMDEFAVVGRLHRIWGWASAHTADGRIRMSASRPQNFRKMSASDADAIENRAARLCEARIDRIANHPGFAQAMQGVGWLEIDSEGILFPHFDRHNSKSAKRRATDSDRKKRVRKVSAPRPQNVRTECGPEKRREEKIKESPNGDSIADPPNWLVIEAEFIQQWNRLKGVAKCSTNALPSNVVNEFQAAWLTPGWWERAEQAMRKFPLPNGVVMGLRKFLQPTTIDEILGGVHAFTRKGDRTQPARPSPSQRHPGDATSAWLVSDDA